MFDYDIWYNGRVIGNIKADTDRKALNAARRIWGVNVTVSRTVRSTTC